MKVASKSGMRTQASHRPHPQLLPQHDPGHRFVTAKLLDLSPELHLNILKQLFQSLAIPHGPEALAYDEILSPTQVCRAWRLLSHELLEPRYDYHGADCAACHNRKAQNWYHTPEYKSWAESGRKRYTELHTEPPHTYIAFFFYKVQLAHELEGSIPDCPEVPSSGA